MSRVQPRGLERNAGKMKQETKRGRRFSLIAAVILVLGVIVGTAAVADGVPAIPHTLEGRSACLECHGEGKMKPAPADHAGRGEATCTGCHHAAE